MTQPTSPNARSRTRNKQQEAQAPASRSPAGAAILAPITAFRTLPSNAMVPHPAGPNGAPVEKQIVNGPVALQPRRVWKLLGFNGPAVQVQTSGRRSRSASRTSSAASRALEETPDTT